LAPDAPEIDLAVTDGAVLFSSYSYKKVSDYTTIKAGTYNLEVRTAGSTTVLFRIPHVLVRDRFAFSLFIEGLSSGVPGLHGRLYFDL